MALFPAVLSRQLDRVRNRLVLAAAGFGSRGRRCYMGRGVRILNPPAVHLGEGVSIGNFSLLSCLHPGSRIELADRVGIGEYVRLEAHGGAISIGEESALLPGCIVYGHGGVSIGSGVYIAARSVIVSANHRFDRTDVPIRHQGERMEGIVIEDDCWLGSGVKVLDGVTIGRGSVVGAGAVVTRNIPPGSVAVGVPARVVRSRLGAERQ